MNENKKIYFLAVKFDRRIYNQTARKVNLVKYETKNGKSEKRELLKRYLEQYHAGKMKRIQLEARLKNIKEEMDAPIGGQGYSPINYRGTNNTGVGAASFVYRMSEIETRIENQKNNIGKALLKVMDILDFLKESSMERIVLELRFIDCKSWKAIERELHLSRRSCFDYQNKALDKLMEFKKVKIILEEYQKQDF